MPRVSSMMPGMLSPLGFDSRYGLPQQHNKQNMPTGSALSLDDMHRLLASSSAKSAYESFGKMGSFIILIPDGKLSASGRWASGGQAQGSKLDATTNPLGSTNLPGWD